MVHAASEKKGLLLGCPVHPAIAESGETTAVVKAEKIMAWLPLLRPCIWLSGKEGGVIVSFCRVTFAHMAAADGCIVFGCCQLLHLGNNGRKSCCFALVGCMCGCVWFRLPLYGHSSSRQLLLKAIATASISQCVLPVFCVA